MTNSTFSHHVGVLQHAISLQYPQEASYLLPRLNEDGSVCLMRGALYATLCIAMQEPLLRPHQPYQITMREDLIGPGALILHHFSPARLPSSISRSGGLGHNEAEFHGPHVIAQHRKRAQLRARRRYQLG